METTKKNKSNKIYKIQLKFQESSLVTFAQSDNLDEAIGLALVLHAKSTEVHQVFVDDGDQVHCVLNLYDFDNVGI